jgi:hypothetical protein
MVTEVIRNTVKFNKGEAARYLLRISSLLLGQLEPPLKVLDKLFLFLGLLQILSVTVA